MRGPSFASLLFCGVLVLGTTSARAGDREACVAASEQGQTSRKAGKLVEAKAKFAICSRDLCPPVVRQDCVTWQDELTKSVPTVTVGVRDEGGHDLLDVRILIDGQLVTEHLDGKSFPVDPGTHVFRAEDGKHAAVEERVLIKEGEKTRAIDLRMAIQQRAVPAQPPVDPPKTLAPVDPRTGRSPVPFVVLGVGAVALGVGLGVHFTGKGNFPENCKSDAAKVAGRDGTCTPTPSDPSGETSGEQAMSAVNLRNVGTGLVVGGGMLVLGGLVWFFIDTPHPKKVTRVLPSVGPGYAGLALGGSF